MEIRLVKISRLLLAILFIFSAITKLLSLPFFDGLVAELLIGKDYYNHADALWYTQALTRILISAELVLGLAVLQESFLKKIIIPAIEVMLVLFTLHLFYESFTHENGFTDGNCGCFGDIIPMNNLESIIKNVIAMILGVIVWKNHKEHPYHQFSSWIVATTVGLVCLITLWLTIKDYSVNTVVTTPSEIVEEVQTDNKALEVKAKADSLVDIQEFSEALLIIENQLEEDSLSMEEHSEFISRLRDVVEIEKIKK